MSHTARRVGERGGSRKKTLVFLAPTPPPYMGPSVATEILLNSKFVEEFEVVHIDTADRRPLSKLGAVDLANVLLALKHYVLLLRCLAFRHVDLVYIPISQTRIGFLRDAVFILMAWLVRKRIVLHLRGGGFRDFYESSGRLMRWVIRRILARADRMIVLGDSLRSLFDSLIAPERVSVVPNGCDLPIDGARARRGQRTAEVSVLFLGNLVESKGFKDVLRAARCVLAKNRDARFIFAGAWMSDEDESECSAFVKTEGLDGRVDFRGAVVRDDKVRLLLAADMLVFPTYFAKEGHPWVIVEAMAAGLPIISTDQGCIRESVIHGDNGFIVPKRSPEALAERIVHLIERPEERRRMGHRSRCLYEAAFTQERFVQRMIDAMSLTLKNGG